MRNCFRVDTTGFNSIINSGKRGVGRGLGIVWSVRGWGSVCQRPLLKPKIKMKWSSISHHIILATPALFYISVLKQGFLVKDTGQKHISDTRFLKEQWCDAPVKSPSRMVALISPLQECWLLMADGWVTLGAIRNRKEETLLKSATTLECSLNPAWIQNITNRPFQVQIPGKLNWGFFYNIKFNFCLFLILFPSPSHCGGF